MDNKEEIKKLNLTHVALTAESLIKIRGWQEQLKNKKEGMELTYKDIINWLIANSNDNLTVGETKDLIEKFFNEESFYRKKLRELKKAKFANNQDINEDLPQE